MADVAHQLTARRIGRVLAAAVLSLASTVVGASPAQAHATLVSVSPQHGEEVASLPGDVVLEFSEEVRGPATISVTTDDGTSLTSGESTILLSTVTQPLVEASGVGTANISYQVTSMDGHLIEGRGLVVYVRGEPLRPEPPPADDNTAREGEEVLGGGSTGDRRSRLLLLVIPGALVLTAVGLRWRQRKERGGQ